MIEPTKSPMVCESYFGGCPWCGKMLCVHAGKVEFGVCDTHRVYWCFGVNLLSGWRYEIERIMERDSVGWETAWETHIAEARVHLADYRKVEPLNEGDLVPHVDPESCVLDADDRRDAWQSDSEAWKA